ncbi:MAG: permease-like cell division protein FtsX [Defluviitaleaceae bacterium]|nr:permease-like cell division protein FtsX [Defluviitaleaceae bacterium]
MKTTPNNRKVKSNKASTLKLRNLRYYLSQTTKSLWRNKFMTISSIITVAACMIMVIASFAATSNLNLFLDHLESTVGMTVFLDEDLSEAGRDIVGQTIMVVENVRDIRIITPEEALENMERQWGMNIEALQGDANPLRWSYMVELYDLSLQSQTVDAVSLIFGVHSIDASADISDTLVFINNVVAIVGLIIIAVLGILSIVIITNTIKLTVNSRRNEIVIMKYVGATDWFIRWPFIIEGVLVGVLGALIPLVAAWFAYDNLVASLTGDTGIFAAMLRGLPFRTTAEIFPFVAPIIILLGAGIGVLGSASSMRKHLNV